MGFSDVPAYSQIFLRQHLVIYLKRIIVIPAVYQTLALLKEGFSYWHWADVTFHTDLFRLAKGCVFIKQSGIPRNCTL